MSLKIAVAAPPDVGLQPAIPVHAAGGQVCLVCRDANLCNANAQRRYNSTRNGVVIIIRV